MPDTIEGDEITRVVGQQRSWALRQGIELAGSGDVLARPDQALLAALDSRTRAELEAGAGKELNRLHHLESSTCLVVNVFEPWRDDPAPLASVLDSDLEADSLELEKRQPTGLRGTAPHLDVLLNGTGPALGIECKFLEMYRGKPEKTDPFSAAYFEKCDLWSRLPKCRELAAQIANDPETFHHLGAAQLLKHTLGLSKNQPDGYRLILVWYRIEGRIAEKIADEIERFSEAVDDIGFEAITYQNLASSLKNLPEPRAGYSEYLSDRYAL